MAHELEVWLFTAHVGTLALVDGQLGFCYASVWLARKTNCRWCSMAHASASPSTARQARTS